MRTRRAVATGVLFAALVAGAASLEPLRPTRAVAQDSLEFETLMARLLGDDPREAEKASDALVALGVSVVPRLSVTTGPVAERVVMLETLGRIAADHDEALSPLVTALADKDPAIRAAAARGLTAAGARASTAAAALEAATRDEDAGVRIEAAAATHRLRPNARAMVILTAGLKEQDPVLRARAAAAVVRA